MNVTFCCPGCHATDRLEFTDDTTSLACPQCGRGWDVPSGAIAEGEVRRCLVCPSQELFVRKDFPQRLGVAIVVTGFAASCVAWANYQLYLTFGILFATALIDVVLYLVMGENLTCYRCEAQYRGLSGLEKHGAFELATHERYRQQAARLRSMSEHRPPEGHAPVT
jgi:hypothetical protein